MEIRAAEISAILKQQIANFGTEAESAEVTSAVALSPAQIEALSAALKGSGGRTVAVTTKIDPSILGGLIVRVGSRMVDSSLKSKLQRLKLAMKGVG